MTGYAPVVRAPGSKVQAWTRKKLLRSRRAADAVRVEEAKAEEASRRLPRKHVEAGREMERMVQGCASW